MPDLSDFEQNADIRTVRVVGDTGLEPVTPAMSRHRISVRYCK